MKHNPSIQKVDADGFRRMPPVKISSLVRDGYFFCESCKRVTEIRDVDEVQHHCVRCNSPRVTWHPPAL